MAKNTAMTEIMALKKAPAKELHRRYKELYGEDATGTHKVYLWRKIAYRLQELEYGGLSAKTKAPPSSVHSFVMGSLCTAAVRPTALAPFPVACAAPARSAT